MESAAAIGAPALITTRGNSLWPIAGPWPSAEPRTGTGSDFRSQESAVESLYFSVGASVGASFFSRLK
jgi:hypothetical protein